MPQTILITGGTGLIGSHLTKLLTDKGHKVRYLSRDPDQSGPVPMYEWDVREGTIDKRALEGVDTIIHLAGAGIADEKWTKERKKVILKSRTESTKLLNKVLREEEHEVKSFISASAIGYYGYDTGGVVKKEDSRFGDDFLATVTKEWESTVDELPDDLRTVKIRIGIVFSTEGGALAEMIKPIKWYVGAPLGSGDQYMSWIHIEDLCRIFAFAAENEELSGIYNAVAPNPATNEEVTKKSASKLGKPVILPNVPGFVLKIMLGEMASMVLGGSKVSSEKIENAGFDFKYPDLDSALNDLLKTS